MHRRLLDAWGDPRALPSTDRYAWQWITHHLVGAGRQNLLSNLLLDPQWMEHRLVVATVEALLADFDFIPDEQPHRSIREAIRMSATTLAADNSQLAAHLRGRLLSASLPGLAPLLDRSGRLPGPRLVPLRASLRVPPSAAPDTVLGHDSEVVVLTTADHGRVVVSGSGDGVLKVWDVRSGALLRTISDDRVDADPSPHPWDDQRLPTWGGGRGPLLAGFAGSRHVVASAGRRLTVWDLDSGARLRVLEAPGETLVTALAVTPNGRYVVSAPGGSLRVWDQETGAVRSGQGNRITTLALAGNNCFVSGSSHLGMGPLGRKSLQANALRVWDPATGRQIRTLEGHPCGVNALVFNGQLVAPHRTPACTCSRTRVLGCGT